MVDAARLHDLPVDRVVPPSGLLEFYRPSISNPNLHQKRPPQNHIQPDLGLGMELDRKARDGRHDSKYDDQEETSTKSPLPSPSPTSPTGTTNSSPIELEFDHKGTMEHDSLVSVCLFEPSRSSLQIDTTVSPPRKNVWGLEDSPCASPTDDADTETIKEERNDEDRSDELKTPASTHSPSLLEELESVQDEDDEEAEDDNNDARSEGSSAESEDVNWDDLQKKEDEQVKEQDAENVSCIACSYG